MIAEAWDMVPNDMKNVNDIKTFKNDIRKWELTNYHFKL